MSSPSASDHPAATVVDTWLAIFSDLERRLRREQLETWFRRVAALELDGGVLTLAVPSDFQRGWIIDNYLDVLTKACRSVVGPDAVVRIVVDPERAVLDPRPREAETAAATAAPEAAPPPAATPLRVTDLPPRADDARPASRAVRPPAPRENGWGMPEPASLGSRDGFPGLSLNTNYVFDHFVVGPCNRFAYAAAMGVAENPAKAYNPFFLHGSVGLGKTHLLQAICHEILQRRPNARILYLSSETFTNHFIAALEKGSLEEFRRRYRGVDMLLIDDVHFLANKERTQEEFFHTFNALFNEHKQIVLSSDSPPKEIPSLQERLVSRFKWGLEAEIEKPCFETRLAILNRKARTMSLSLPDDVARFLAERIVNNIRELEGAINRVVGYAALQREPMTLALVRRAMPELEADRTAVVRFEDLASVVGRRFNVKLLDLQSRRRHQSIAFPRQIAMFLARRHTKHSLEEIGAYFGGRDHTTVLYGIEKIGSLLESDPSIRETVNALSDEIARVSPRGA
ncbi:MAG TPA: chromosomal replication initiator protein DnaA [Planctomycetota bacterium]|nr:chromosomal replication initiator protein DnaA [Planctomycetota bacterium]